MIYLASVDSSGSYLPSSLADSKCTQLLKIESYFNNILPSTIFFSTITFEKFAGRTGGTFCLEYKLSFDLAINLDPYENVFDLCNLLYIFSCISTTTKYSCVRL